MSEFVRHGARRVPGGCRTRGAATVRGGARGSRIVDRGSRIVARGSGMAALVGVLLLVACGEAPDGSEAGAVADTAAGMGEASAVGASTAGPVGVLNPWVRMAIMPEGSDAQDAPPVNSAAYFVLTNPTGEVDALVAVETEVADTAEIHSVTMDEGVMRMRPVDSVAVPAAGEVVLEPGGYHIMLIGLRRPLAEGDSVALRLRLRSGEVIDVTAPVLRSPPL